MAVLMRTMDDWREPTAPTKPDAIAGSLMGVEYVDDDLPPPPHPARVSWWPLAVSLAVNVVLLGALVRLVVAR